MFAFVTNVRQLFAFACKTYSFSIALLFVFFPRRDFSRISENSEENNIVPTIKELTQFS